LRHAAINGQYRSLDRQQAHFRRNPAKPRKPTELASSCQDSVAWHDERDGIVPKRLANRAGGAWFTNLDCNFTIGRRATGVDSTRRRVHALMKRRHPLQIEGNVGEIRRSACQERREIVDRSPYDVSRRSFARASKPPSQTSTRSLGVLLRQLYPADAKLGPGDTANADGGFEQRKECNCHD
jgi:hypothetical protein